jgi:hypothetical protein
MNRYGIDSEAKPSLPIANSVTAEKGMAGRNPPLRINDIYPRRRPELLVWIAPGVSVPALGPAEWAALFFRERIDVNVQSR